MSRGLKKHMHVFYVESSYVYYNRIFKMFMKYERFRCYMPNCNKCYMEERFLTDEEEREYVNEKYKGKH